MDPKTVRKLKKQLEKAIAEMIGPVPVPKEVTEICKKMWDISGSVVKTSRGWRFLEVWHVSP